MVSFSYRAAPNYTFTKTGLNRFRWTICICKCLFSSLCRAVRRGDCDQNSQQIQRASQNILTFPGTIIDTVRAMPGEINENMTSALFNFTSLCKALDSAVSKTYFIYCLFLLLFFSRKLFITDKSTWLTVTRHWAKSLS